MVGLWGGSYFLEDDLVVASLASAFRMIRHKFSLTLAPARPHLKLYVLSHFIAISISLDFCVVIRTLSFETASFSSLLHCVHFYFNCCPNWSQMPWQNWWSLWLPLTVFSVAGFKRANSAFRGVLSFPEEKWTRPRICWSNPLRPLLVDSTYRQCAWVYGPLHFNLLWIRYVRGGGRRRCQYVRGIPVFPSCILKPLSVFCWEG